MANARWILIALMSLLPATALAHGSDGHPADPNLHVDPTLEDCSVIFAANLTQGAFRRFAREFGSVSAFKPMSSAVTLGKWGFTLGIEQISFTVDEHSDAWNDTFHHPDAYHELGSELDFPRFRARLGVTDRMDVGAYWTRNPNANYGWLGLEGKYGLWREGESMPVSVAMRGAWTRTLYVEDMDMHAITTEVGASRTFRGVLTPYLWLGNDLVLVGERSDVVSLERETLFIPHAIGGLEARWWHIAIGAEAHVSELTSIQFNVATVF